MTDPLRAKTARTLKWNTVDRLGSQVLYAVTGVILANMLSHEDYGLVGALLVFQAFGTIFIDSGFGSAMLQRKEPTQRDWSTVFWFNMAVSVAVYAVLFFSAGAISDIFQHDRRLVPLSRVMFLSFILNALSMVQSTRMMKMMDVRHIAGANLAGLTVSGITGITLAFTGYGAWALVWQTLALGAVKAGWLWTASGWRPSAEFSTATIRGIWRLGLSVFSTSALNTFFLNVYSFVIGAFYSLATLGVYTQADKWSKMGSASISQVFTASFVPMLAACQDDEPAFCDNVRRINRLAAFISFPALTGLAALGGPVFHTLFGNKWDAAIIPFCILAVRGLPVVFQSLYCSYILALGYGKTLVKAEVMKDVFTLAALGATVFSDRLDVLVGGQLAASLLTYAWTLRTASRHTGIKVGAMLADLWRPALGAACAAALAASVVFLDWPAWAQLGGGIILWGASYLIVSKLTGIYELKSVLKYLGLKH